MQTIELRIGDEDNQGTVQFKGEPLATYEDSDTSMTLYTHNGGYLVYVDVETYYGHLGSALHPEPEYNPAEQVHEPAGGYTAEEVAEHYPEFAEDVGVTLVSEEER